MLAGGRAMTIREKRYFEQSVAQGTRNAPADTERQGHEFCHNLLETSGNSTGSN
jgi:hypothetical protein